MRSLKAIAGVLLALVLGVPAIDLANGASGVTALPLRGRPLQQGEYPGFVAKEHAVAVADVTARAKVAATDATVARSVVPGRIAFLRYLNATETSGAIFTSAADGSGELQVTTPGASTLDDEPDWSSDGRRLVFTRVTNAGTDHEAHQLFVVASDGTGLTPLTRGRPARGNFIAGFDGTGAFSPDGKRIAFSYAHGKVGPGATGSGQIKFSDIWVMAVDGTHRRQVTHSPAYAGDAGGVAWSPDGKRLVYARSNALASSPAGGQALFIINADGSHGRQLTPWSLGADGTPDWSPATNRIVFRAVVNEASGVGNFFTIKPDGTSLTKITRFAHTVISHKVGFSPDGKRIAFAKQATNGKNDLFTAKLNGSDLRRVTNTPVAESSPDWGRSG